MKSPVTKKTEALRDLLGTAQYLNRQAAALRTVRLEMTGELAQYIMSGNPDLIFKEKQYGFEMW